MHREANIFKTKPAAARRKRKGFTLIELVVVIAIIAILVALIAPNLIGYLGQADDTKGQAAAKSVYTAVVAKNAAGQIKPLGKNVDIKLNSGTLANYLNSREVEDIQSTSGGTTKAATATVCVGDDGVVKAVRVMFGDGEDTKTYYYPEGSDSLFGEASVDADEEDGGGGEAETKVAGLYQNGVMTYSWEDLVSMGTLTISGTDLSRINYGVAVNPSMGACDIVIAEGITSIGKTGNGFASFTPLKSVVLPKSLQTLDYAFNTCSSLASIDFNGASVTEIGAESFNQCRALPEINLPSGLKTIGYRAFANCDSLTSLTVPNGVTTIGEQAFSNIPQVYYSGTATGSPWSLTGTIIN